MIQHNVQHSEVYDIPQHGAATRWIHARYPNAPAPVIDLSTGINPYGYPLAALDDALYRRLPDPEEIIQARQAVRRYCGADARVQAVLSPGMQPLMFALAAYRQQRRVAIISPTYSEHEKIWRQCGHKVENVSALEGVAAQADVVVLCNPNNPDGMLHTSGALRDAVAHSSPDRLWVVDESFADLEPQHSLAHVADARLVVLRSVGKFFGLAGLRVSAALCQGEMAQWLEGAAGPWPVSTVSCHLLPGMLADTGWQTAMRRRLHEEAKEFRAMLACHFTIVGHTDLFTLVASDHALARAEHFASRGIALRRFDAQPHWLRIGLPAQTDLLRVQAALECMP